MRYVVAIEVEPGEYESHLFNSPQHFSEWMNQQHPKPKRIVARSAITIFVGAGAELLPEVDHRGQGEAA